MEGSCSTGQSPQRAVVPVEEEEVPSTPFPIHYHHPAGLKLLTASLNQHK
jgi:hypothetical protein